MFTTLLRKQTQSLQMIYQPWLYQLWQQVRAGEEIERILQARIDKLVRWAEVWGLELNLPKTVSMFFTRETSQALHLTIQNTVVKQVEQKKYLGFMVDPQLTFLLHVDYAVCKTKKALAKASLLKCRFGLPVHIFRDHHRKKYPIQLSVIHV